MKPIKLSETKPTIRFRAALFGASLTLPENVKLAVRGSTVVEGTINAFPFQNLLEPDGKGGFVLDVSGATQKVIKARVGDMVDVEVIRIGEDVETRVPAELFKSLQNISKARATWIDITPLARRDWVLWISTAKQAETRRRRIDNASDMLSAGKRRVCCFPGIKWLMKKRTV